MSHNQYGNENFYLFSPSDFDLVKSAQLLSSLHFIANLLLEGNANNISFAYKSFFGFYVPIPSHPNQFLEINSALKLKENSEREINLI
jgi:hypothetical protein